jgi:hypothetical protein
MGDERLKDYVDQAFVETEVAKEKERDDHGGIYSVPF